VVEHCYTTQQKVRPKGVNSTGKEDDGTGLYYYGARYYDPEIGRFTQPDSYVQAPFDPQSLNRYAYCRNNPLIYIDPTGHFFGFIAAFLGFVAKVATAVSIASTMAATVCALTGNYKAAQQFAKIGQISGLIGIGSGIASATIGSLTGSITEFTTTTTYGMEGVPRTTFSLTHSMSPLVKEGIASATYSAMSSGMSASALAMNYGAKNNQRQLAYAERIHDGMPDMFGYQGPMEKVPFIMMRKTVFHRWYADYMFKDSSILGGLEPAKLFTPNPSDTVIQHIMVPKHFVHSKTIEALRISTGKWHLAYYEQTVVEKFIYQYRPRDGYYQKQ